MEANSVGNGNADGRERALIIQLWEEAGRPPVDGDLLDTIRARWLQELSSHDSIGPAAIARVLADEGAELKHPEVIEADAAWRQAILDVSVRESDPAELLAAEVMTLAAAETFMGRLEDFRVRYERIADKQGVAQVRSIAAEARRLAEAIASNRSTDRSMRTEQSEIAEWLKLWLQTPALFKDWLELRKESDEFRWRFGKGQ